MTAPLVQNITITRGDDWGATVTLDQPVAGFTEIRFTVRETWALEEADNTAATLTKSLTLSGTYTADIDLTNEETVALTNDEYVYDVAVITSVGSKKYTTQRGFLRMAPDVSR